MGILNGILGINQGLWGQGQGQQNAEQVQLAPSALLKYTTTGALSWEVYEPNPISYEPLTPIAIKHNGKKLIIWEP